MGRGAEGLAEREQENKTLQWLHPSRPVCPPGRRQEAQV